MLENPAWMKDFKISDYQCHCFRCVSKPDRPHTKLEVMRAVQWLRDALGRPLVVTRGVSCAEHNAEIGGAHESRHLPEYADAVDLLALTGVERFDIVAKAMRVPSIWTVFEIAKKHVHLDSRPSARMFIATPGLEVT